jgi:aryl carrier-like protein
MTQREDLETGHTTFSAGNTVSNRVLTPDESPQGETEATVERVFAEILGASDLPRTVSLFDLGLDSVAVTLACARLEQATGVRVRFSQLFRTPTISQLAGWIDATRDRGYEGPGIPATPPASEGATLVAITPMQASAVPYDIVPTFAWWFDGEIDDVALASAANDIHRRHQTLHAKYFDEPDLGLAEVPVDPGPAEFHRLGQEGTDAAADDALSRTLRLPLRLGEGEVWRCAIVRSRQSGRTKFGVAINHAAFDGHSIGILTAELSAAYSARAAGAAPQWPDRVVSIAEIAADYRHQLAALDVDAQRRYWRSELSEVPGCYLPGRKDETVPPFGPASANEFTVQKDQLRVWEDYARANGMPPSVGMAAAYVQAIIRAGGPRDFALMVAIANRAGEIIDRTITNRVGHIFLRPNGPSRSGPHILARMRDSYLQAMALKDVLLDPEEIENIINLPHLHGLLYRGVPNLVYQDSVPTFSLGGVIGSLDSRGGWTHSPADLVLAVRPGPEGLGMSAVARTDIYETSLADRLGQHFIDIINDGPERLERETAR